VRLLQLVFVIGVFWFIGQYSKSFGVPVATATVRKPASIKDLLRNLTPNRARGYILQKGVYTKVEIEPGENHMIFNFILRDGSARKFLVYNLESKEKDPGTVAGTFTQGSLLYLTFTQKQNRDRVYSGWIISPDRAQASPLALIEPVVETNEWPKELDVSPYLQAIN
jgi:hypothetical protein